MSTTLGTYSETVVPPRLIVVHGYQANPTKHWFPWLQRSLPGVNVQLLNLPNSDSPQAAEWLDTLKSEIGAVDEQTYLVGHSLGCVTILRYLISLPQPWRLGGIFFVAGFIDTLEVIPELNEFLAPEINPVILVNRIRSRVMFLSDNDPIVPVGASWKLAKLLRMQVQLVPGASHFLEDNGIMELPPLLTAVQQALKDPGSAEKL